MNSDRTQSTENQSRKRKAPNEKSCSRIPRPQSPAPRLHSLITLNPSEMEQLKMKNTNDLSVEECQKLAKYLRESSKDVLNKRSEEIGKETKTSEASTSADSDDCIIIEVVRPPTSVSTSDRNNKNRGNRLKLFKKSEMSRVDLEMELSVAIKNAKLTSYNENALFLLFEKNIRRDIENDPQLKKFYRRTFSGTIDTGVMKTMAKRMMNHIKRVLSENDNQQNSSENDNQQSSSGNDNQQSQTDLPSGINELFLPFISNVKYTPPTTRVCIREGSSQTWKTPTSLYSDIPEEMSSKFDLKETTVFEFSERNSLDEEKNEKLLELTKQAEGNLICCACCSSDPIVPCWQNKECPCFNMNLTLRKIQKQKHSFHAATNFSTFEPILFPTKEEYFYTIGFACSEMCGCEGRCTNNVTLLPEKQLFRFELFRRNATLGFGLRTMTAIPAGTPVFEFVGEIMREEQLPEDDHDYTYTFITAQEIKTLAKPLVVAMKHKGWSRKFKASFVKLLSQNWHINPKRFGNIARFLCHSCEPNLAFVRVFQKGFSPAHVRILVVTLEDIFPGVELTFDYGSGYSIKCACNQIGCIRNKNFSQISKSSEEAFQEYYALRQHFEFQRYEENITKKIQKQKK